MDIRLGLLQVGDIMIGAVNAEVFNPIAQRLKKESPYTRTMVATLTNGSARSGYTPHVSGCRRLRSCLRVCNGDVPRRFGEGIDDSVAREG